MRNQRHRTFNTHTRSSVIGPGQPGSGSPEFLTVLLLLHSGNAEAIEPTNSLLTILTSHGTEIESWHLKDVQRPWGLPLHVIEIWFWLKVTGRVNLWGLRIWSSCYSTRVL